MQKLLLFLSFGIKGDFVFLRKLTLKYKLFYPLYKLYESFHCAVIPLKAHIDCSVIFPHSIYGIFISQFCSIGKNVTIMQHVTIGSNFVSSTNSEGKIGAPIIGNNVFIGAGAKIIGKVIIGDNVKIGAGCIVVTDIPSNATVVMNKPKIIIRNK